MRKTKKMKIKIRTTKPSIIIANLALLVSLLFTQATFAHGNSPGHAHGQQGVSPDQALNIAQVYTAKLTTSDAGLGFGQLVDSWNNIPDEDVRMHKTGNAYYIVAVENKAEGKTLYLLMAKSGGLYDANMSGEFPKLNQ